MLNQLPQWSTSKTHNLTWKQAQNRVKIFAVYIHGIATYQMNTRSKNSNFQRKFSNIFKVHDVGVEVARHDTQFRSQPTERCTRETRFVILYAKWKIYVAKNDWLLNITTRLCIFIWWRVHMHNLGAAPFLLHWNRPYMVHTCIPFANRVQNKKKKGKKFF